MSARKIDLFEVSAPSSTFVRPLGQRKERVEFPLGSKADFQNVRQSECEAEAVRTELRRGSVQITNSHSPTPDRLHVLCSFAFPGTHFPPPPNKSYHVVSLFPSHFSPNPLCSSEMSIWGRGGERTARVTSSFTSICVCPQPEATLRRLGTGPWTELGRVWQFHNVFACFKIHGVKLNNSTTRLGWDLTPTTFLVCCEWHFGRHA